MTRQGDNGEAGTSPQGAGRDPQRGFPLSHLLARMAWDIVWAVLFRLSPRLLHAWRRMLLRCFGAKIGRGVLIYPTTRIWAPWNLQLDDASVVGPHVDCYCVAKIHLAGGAVVSQYSYLCTATRDIDHPDKPLVYKPIEIGPKAWVCADVFIGPGVTVGEGAVVGARASAFRDVKPWTVVAGNPARHLRDRQVPHD